MSGHFIMAEEELQRQEELQRHLGIHKEAPGIPRVAQGFPKEVLSGVQGIPRELGLPEARDALAA